MDDQGQGRPAPETEVETITSDDVGSVEEVLTPTVTRTTAEQAEKDYLGDPEAKADPSDSCDDEECCDDECEEHGAETIETPIDEPDGSGMVLRLRKSLTYLVSKDEFVEVAKLLDTDQKLRMAADLIARVMVHKCDCCDHDVLGDVMAGKEPEVFASIGLGPSDLIALSNAVIPEIEAMGV